MNLGQISVTSEQLSFDENSTIVLQKYNFKFEPWSSDHNLHTYGGKAILEYNNEPLFAELVILRLLEKQGFKGAWVDTYSNKFWQRLPHISLPVILDSRLTQIYESIRQANDNRSSGCFDIIAYREEQVFFAELKRRKKDRIRTSQIRWLQAALSAGYQLQDFIICEWDIV